MSSNNRITKSSYRPSVRVWAQCPLWRKPRSLGLFIGFRSLSDVLSSRSREVYSLVESHIARALSISEHHLISDWNSLFSDSDETMLRFRLRQDDSAYSYYGLLSPLVMTVMLSGICSKVKTN